MKAADVLRSLALRYPDIEEGVACKGTALESTTYRAKKKAFLFVRQKDGALRVMLKLDGSKAEAAKLAKSDPRYAIGSGGWLTAVFEDGDAPPRELFARWIEESFRAVSGAGAKPSPGTRAAASSRGGRRRRR